MLYIFDNSIPKGGSMGLSNAVHLDPYCKDNTNPTGVNVQSS